MDEPPPFVVLVQGPPQVRVVLGMHACMVLVHACVYAPQTLIHKGTMT